MEFGDKIATRSTCEVARSVQSVWEGGKEQEPVLSCNLQAEVLAAAKRGECEESLAEVYASQQPPGERAGSRAGAGS